MAAPSLKYQVELERRSYSSHDTSCALVCLERKIVIFCSRDNRACLQVQSEHLLQDLILEDVR